MARPVTFTWPLESTNAFALTQAVAENVPAVLNGALTTVVPQWNNASAVYVNNRIGYFNPGGSLNGVGSRTVSISSPDDLSANSFTITGTLNGNIISETIVAGPHANTVFSVNFYDSLISVTSDLPSTNLTIGTGTTGYTQWYLSNYQSTVKGLSVQVHVAGTITYSFQTTLDDVQIITAPLTFTPVVNLTAKSDNELGFYDAPARYSRIAITASDNTGSLVATFTEQGLT